MSGNDDCKNISKSDMVKNVVVNIQPNRRELRQRDLTPKEGNGKTELKNHCLFSMKNKWKYLFIFLYWLHGAIITFWIFYIVEINFIFSP